LDFLPDHEGDSLSLQGVNSPRKSSSVLQVGGVSNEPVKYGREFCRTSTQRVTALARPRSNCTSKSQTQPLVRQGAPYQEPRNCQRDKKIWSWAPDGILTPRQTGRLTVGHKLTSVSDSSTGNMQKQTS
jgi:hypothetical protein